MFKNPMPAKHSRHVALTAPLAHYVETQVAAGTYSSASEVVRAALRLLIEREEDRTQHQKELPNREQKLHG